MNNDLYFPPSIYGNKVDQFDSPLPDISDGQKRSRRSGYVNVALNNAQVGRKRTKFKNWMSNNIFKPIQDPYSDINENSSTASLQDEIVLGRDINYQPRNPIKTAGSRSRNDYGRSSSNSCNTFLTGNNMSPVGRSRSRAFGGSISLRNNLIQGIENNHESKDIDKLDADQLLSLLDTKSSLQINPTTLNCLQKKIADVMGKKRSSANLLEKTMRDINIWYNESDFHQDQDTRLVFQHIIDLLTEDVAYEKRTTYILNNVVVELKSIHTKEVEFNKKRKAFQTSLKKYAVSKQKAQIDKVDSILEETVIDNYDRYAKERERFQEAIATKLRKQFILLAYEMYDSSLNTEKASKLFIEDCLVELEPYDRKGCCHVLDYLREGRRNRKWKELTPEEQASSRNKDIFQSGLFEAKDALFSTLYMTYPELFGNIITDSSVSREKPVLEFKTGVEDSISQLSCNNHDLFNSPPDTNEESINSKDEAGLVDDFNDKENTVLDDTIRLGEQRPVLITNSTPNIKHHHQYHTRESTNRTLNPDSSGYNKYVHTGPSTVDVADYEIGTAAIEKQNWCGDSNQ